MDGRKEAIWKAILYSLNWNKKKKKDSLICIRSHTAKFSCAYLSLILFNSDTSRFQKAFIRKFFVWEKCSEFLKKYEVLHDRRAIRFIARNSLSKVLRSLLLLIIITWCMLMSSYKQSEQKYKIWFSFSIRMYRTEQNVRTMQQHWN